MNVIVQYMSTNDLPRLKKKLSRSSLSSSTSELYNDDKEFLKVFNNSDSARKLFYNEKKAYEEVNKIKELEPYVPKLLRSSSSKNNKYLLLENRGQDGICLVNDNYLTFDIWKKFLVDVSTALKLLHDNNLYHGDIKPENVTYDFNTGKWSLIDFGFCYNQDRQNGGMIGTIPYCSPHLAIQRIAERTKRASPNINRNRIGDIYSFAITALSLIGYYFSVEDIPNIKLNIAELVRLYNKDVRALTTNFIPKNTRFDEWTKEIVHLLAGMALTQLEVEYNEVVWSKNKCVCYFSSHNNKHQILESYDIIYFWKKFDVLTNIL